MESVAGIFDEIIVVDTGSTDRTREIAREFGAKVFDFPGSTTSRRRGTRRCRMRRVIMCFGSMPMMWSSRRNGRSMALLAGLTNGLDRSARRRARFLRGPPALAPPWQGGEMVCFARLVMRRRAPTLTSCRCACDPSPDGTGGDTVVDHIRLFPLRDDVRWTYRVHEQILPALTAGEVPVRWTDLTVRHTGYVDKALRTRKLERDISDSPARAEGAAG